MDLIRLFCLWRSCEDPAGERGSDSPRSNTEVALVPGSVDERWVCDSVQCLQLLLQNSPFGICTGLLMPGEILKLHSNISTRSVSDRVGNSRQWLNRGEALVRVPAK